MTGLKNLDTNVTVLGFKHVKISNIIEY